MYSILDVLSYVPLSQAVETVKAGIPKVLPEEFWTTTEDVQGRIVQNVEYAGTRRTARLVPFGAPSRITEKLPLSDKVRVMLHSREQISFADEFLNYLREWNEYKPQQKFAMAEVARQGDSLRQKFENLEIATVQMLLANGVLYFDGDGNLLANSSGAKTTIDEGIPAANKGQLNGLVSASWADPATDIIGQLRNLNALAVRTSGYPLKYAFYGQNVASYVFKNSSINLGVSYQGPKFDQYYTGGVIPDGFMGLTWIPVQNAFYEDYTGTLVQYWPADQITFTPEINSTTYTFYKGSELIPSDLNVVMSANGEVNAATAGLGKAVEVFGRGRYAKLFDDPFRLIDIASDTFRPALRVPTSYFQMDTTP